MTVADALRRLNDAADLHPPACQNDPRFIDDSPAEWIVTDLKRICSTCPLFPECDDLRQALKPAAGFWAGRQHPDRGGRRKAAHA